MSQQEKTYLLIYAPNEDSISLRICAVLLESPWLACKDFAQFDLNLRWARMSKGTFSDITAHSWVIILINKGCVQMCKLLADVLPWVPVPVDAHQKVQESSAKKKTFAALLNTALVLLFSLQIMLRPFMTAVTVLSHATLSYASPAPKQYGAVLDAGSSSTKVRVYAWEKLPGKIPKVEEIFYSKVKPGISDFEDSVHEITNHILQITTAIKEAVPEDLWQITPVYFMATAGNLICREREREREREIKTLTVFQLITALCECPVFQIIGKLVVECPLKKNAY